jgi:hypothetical protein
LEHPAAINATTSRWRSVSGASAAVFVLVMRRFFRPSFEGSIRQRV